MSERKWERFSEVAAKKYAYSKGVRVSVNPMGEITFDVGTYRAMGEPQAMYLMYEAATQTIGMEPGNADEPNAVLVRARHAKSNRVVRSIRFFKKYGILPTETLVLPWAYLEGKVLILDMRTAVSLGAGWKKAESAELRRVERAEAMADRDRRREEIRAEKERLKAERHQLSLDRARLAHQERMLRRQAAVGRRQEHGSGK